jgi:hypothetical protein
MDVPQSHESVDSRTSMAGRQMSTAELAQMEAAGYGFAQQFAPEATTVPGELLLPLLPGDRTAPHRTQYAMIMEAKPTRYAMITEAKPTEAVPNIYTSISQAHDDLRRFTGRHPDNFAFGRHPDNFAFGRHPDNFAFGRHPDNFAFGRHPDNFAFGRHHDSNEHSMYCVYWTRWKSSVAVTNG